jgi:hypothetical protein
MDGSIDIAALAHAAGIPADDPGVQAFLPSRSPRACEDICAAAQPYGDADHVTAEHARAVGRELALQIRAKFELD